MFGAPGWLMADFANVAPLPAPPLWESWLLERPWPTGIGMLVLGVAAALMMIRRGKDRSGIIAGVVLGLCAAGVIALGTVVHTPRERLMGRTRAFVDAVARGDDRTVAGMLSDRLVLRSDGQVLSVGGEWVIGIVRGFKNANVIQSHRLEDRGVFVEGDSARTRVSVRVDSGNQGGGVVGTQWELAWRRVIDTWKIDAIDCLSIAGQRPDASWVSHANTLAR